MTASPYKYLENIIFLKQNLLFHVLPNQIFIHRRKRPEKEIGFVIDGLFIKSSLCDILVPKLALN